LARWFGGVVLVSFVGLWVILCGCFFEMLWVCLLLSFETFNLDVLRLCLLNHGVGLCGGDDDVWWWLVF